MDKFDIAVKLIRAERKRQIEKWGEQEHSYEHWLAILVEEVGEAAKALVEFNYPKFIVEIIHVAAVAVQIIEVMI